MYIQYEKESTKISLASGLTDNYLALSGTSIHQKVKEVEFRIPGQNINSEATIQFFDGNPASGNSINNNPIHVRATDYYALNFYDLNTGSVGIRTAGLADNDDLYVAVEYQQ